ncbi:MAG TPA: hypothetical protein VGI33_02930, partial [Paenibacillus sp.]
QRKNVSLGRVNFHFEESQQDKKTIALHLHPNGNGFVYAGLLQGYDSDEKGFVNIREFAADELKTLVEASIHSLSSSREEVHSVGDRIMAESNFHEAEVWTNDDEQLLSLIHDDDLWYIYTGQNVEMVFETLKEAKEYLREEGFTHSKK